MRLLDTIKIEGPLTDLGWARALFLTEASFGSQLVVTGWEWEIGQSGAKDVLVLRSLQQKVSTDERSRLLQENVTFQAPVRERAEKPSPVHSSACAVELDDDERRLISTAIGAYTTSPRHGFGILAPIIGQRSFETWSNYVAQLHRAVAGNLPHRNRIRKRPRGIRVAIQGRRPTRHRRAALTATHHRQRRSVPAIQRERHLSGDPVRRRARVGRPVSPASWSWLRRRDSDHHAEVDARIDNPTIRGSATTTRRP
jgi:hypothetical protein